ncbi:hypothetical protein [Aeoliella sp.]|uniref:hypothetical protein n=1 Tax=Aeoliella sp. TaxID=2795800 RepID=UPI003CCC0A7E
MHSDQYPIAELYWALLDYRGADVYSDLLAPWLNKQLEVRHWIQEFETRSSSDWTVATEEDLWMLYALSRVTSTLLLCFQTRREGQREVPSPSLTVDDFQQFHEQLGFQVVSPQEYHPFFHEILDVTPTEDAQSPIRVKQCDWPCLMLDNMLFLRAGCAITGGASHVVKETAENSKLYWTFCRLDRPHDDLSHGWGHNSQWRTSFRRDYHVNGEYHFNVDASHSLNEPNCSVEEVSPAVMVELVRNRCVIRTSIADGDLYPYEYSWTEST